LCEEIVEEGWQLGKPPAISASSTNKRRQYATTARRSGEKNRGSYWKGLNFSLLLTASRRGLGVKEIRVNRSPPLGLPAPTFRTEADGAKFIIRKKGMQPPEGRPREDRNLRVSSYQQPKRKGHLLEYKEVKKTGGKEKSLLQPSFISRRPRKEEEPLCEETEKQE